MAHLAAVEAVRTPVVDVDRLVAQNDEAMSSGIYVVDVLTVLKHTFKSDFWRNNARFSEARQRLAATESLASGWGAYDSESPNELAHALATKALNTLESASLPPTRLSPTVEGGIAISFIQGGQRAIIEIHNSGEIIAATYSDEGEPVVWEVNDTDDLLSAIKLIRVHLSA